MNNPLDTTLFDRAAQLAIEAHKDTERRGKGFPYIIHPMEAAAIVATITKDPELLAAAVLHDTVEDTDVTIEQLQNLFGERVARLVMHETAPQNKGLFWREKKQAQILQLASAEHDSKIVAMGDKLSNMRGIANDYRLIGDRLWSRFHAPGGKKDVEWYYRGLASALFELAETLAYQEFVTLLDQTFGEMDYAEAWRVDIGDYEETGGGYMATSYNHKDGTTMAKFYKTHIDPDIPRHELIAAHSVFRMGIPTPMPGRFITDGSRYGAEFRRINPKESFARYVSNRPDSYEDIAHRFARMCLDLHHTPCDTSLFPSAKESALQVIDRCQSFNADEKAQMRAFVEAVRECRTCLHGDMHIGNVITTDLGGDLSATWGQQDFWIDMGDFSWGDPQFDLGWFYFICNNGEEAVTQHLFHIGAEMIRKIWNVFIRDYYSIESDADQQAIEERLKPFAALRLVHYGTVDNMRPMMLQFIRQAFGFDRA